MKKRINLNLFEGMFCCSLIPHLGCFFATFTIVLSFLGKYPVKSISWIIYVTSILFWIISVVLFFFVNIKQTNVIILKPEELCFLERKSYETFACSSVVNISYTPCSMARLLFPFTMYLNGRGVCILKIDGKKEKKIYLFNRDYQKLISHIRRYSNREL